MGENPSFPAGRVMLLLYLFVAAHLIPIFPHGGSANETTRWATDAALVERHSFEITWSEPLLGPVVDGARVGDRIYSNKPPATALLALPGYVAGRVLTGAPDASNIRVTWTLMRWCVATLPLLALGWAFWKRGASPLVLSVVLFGTPLFLYSLLLFSHVLVAVGIFGAYRLLFASDRECSPRMAFLAGGFCGIAVCSEFPAALVVAIFGAAILLVPARAWAGKLSNLFWFVLGGVPFAAALAAYNSALFGSPLAFSYAHETFQQWAQVAQKGLFGISWPDPANVWLLLVSPSRGMFFYSPILILSAVSLLRISGEEAVRKRVRLAAVIGGIVLLSGHGAAHGGWAAGPRYLVFVLPFLIEPFLEKDWFAERPRLAGLLLGTSIVFCVLPALSFPFAPPEVSFPHNTFWRPLLTAEGWATPTLGALVGLGPGLPALIPVLAALGGALILALRTVHRSLRIGICAGIALAGLYLFVPGLDSVDTALRRASISDRYFRPQERLDPFRRLATDPAQLRSLESTRWLIADTWPAAPSNWPYSDAPLPVRGPSAVERQAVAFQSQGKIDEAVRLLRGAREEFPYARCTFSDELAIALYASGEKDSALEELERARPLVAENFGSGCRQVLFHLGHLYVERGRLPEAVAAFRAFLEATEGDTSPITVRSREQAHQALEALARAPEPEPSPRPPASGPGRRTVDEPNLSGGQLR